MNKKEIFYKLYEQNYMKELHEELTIGLVTTLKQEYLGWVGENCKNPTMERANSLAKIPFLYNQINMFVSMLLHSVVEKVTAKIIDIILSKKVINTQKERIKRVKKLIYRR